MGEDGDDLPDVRWFAGTRGVSQSCDELCASIEECGTADDPAPCPEPPTCIKGWLEQAWTESACALLQTARQEAGVVAWTSCSLCAPPDYCQSSSCMFCAPGVLETQAPTTAYRGTSVASPDVCANQYLDDRTQPLCPCFLPPLPPSIGWTISACIVGGLAAYLLGGWGCGRFVAKERKLPREGDGCLAHPDGVGAAAWHPHYDALCEVWVLVGEGCLYFLAWLDAKRLGVPFVYEKLGDGAPLGGRDSEGGVASAKRSNGQHKKAKERKKDKGSKAKRERPAKPRPSSQQSEQVEALGLMEVADVEEGVHPSMARIKVVLERQSAPPEPEPEPKPRPKRKKKTSPRIKEHSRPTGLE